MCSITIDDTYERVGVEENSQHILNSVEDEFEPEETYIIPNNPPPLQENKNNINGEY